MTHCRDCKHWNRDRSNIGQCRIISSGYGSYPRERRTRLAFVTGREEEDLVTEEDFGCKLGEPLGPTGPEVPGTPGLYERGVR